MNSDIPYTTLTDICSGRVQLEKCSEETTYKLAKEPVDVDFIIDTLEKEDIRHYYDR